MHELVRSDPAIELVWRAFELRPEPVPTLDPKGDYLQRGWAKNVYPLADRLGVTMKLPPVQPRSRLAHQAAHWARSEGRFDDYHAAIFRAFFQKGQHIGDIGVLTSLAAGLGLEAKSLRRALESGQFEQSVLGDEEDARTLNVTGVPAFVANRSAALSGVQPVDNLKRLVEHARAPDVDRS